MMSSAAERCLFCKIASGEDDKTTLVHQDDSFVAFADIKPAAKHHFLVVPKQHVSSVKSLNKDDVQLIENMVQLGIKVLADYDVDPSRTRFGFHWPPFCSINHLHLHCIAPVDDMTFVGRMIFRPGTIWFANEKETIDWLKKH
ncbi:Histidine triad nucleotide-binding protein 3 [Halotydeus destructor]|nr:Histidine triad nucleotide-binding protein 3 [Halotydeus destructor]